MTLVRLDLGLRISSRELARMTAIFNPFSEALASMEDRCRWSESKSGHRDRYGTGV